MGEHLGSNGEILKEESPEIPQEIPNMTRTSYSHVFQNAAMSKNLGKVCSKDMTKPLQNYLEFSLKIVAQGTF